MEYLFNAEMRLVLRSICSMRSYSVYPGVIGCLGSCDGLKGIYPEFQVIHGFLQKIPADLLSYDQIHS